MNDIHFELSDSSELSGVLYRELVNAPVIKWDSGEARYDTMLATSSF